MDYRTAFPEKECVLFSDGPNASLGERTRNWTFSTAHKHKYPRPHESDFGVRKRIEPIRSPGGSPGYRGV